MLVTVRLTVSGVIHEMEEFYGMIHKLFRTPNLINCTTLAIGLAIITIALSPITAALGEASMVGTRQQLFGCQYYGDTMHCNVLLNHLQGYEAAANYTLVHPVTNDQIRYVDGKIGKAVEMRSEYRESIEMMNVPAINTKQFSVSFWVKNSAVEPYG
ncbi:MAG TPA: hypothetical protein VE199_00225, partial [Nitrososphaera sp.]|nr:hypothetical protein [Nitrososphaera sp.]